jgi:hypothetical protein
MSNGLGSKGTDALSSNTNSIFAGSGGFAGTGIYISTNNGLNWNQSSLNWGTVSAFGINGNNIFAGMWQHISRGLYRSTDNGLSWSYAGFQSEGILSLAVSGNNVFAGTNGNGIYVSTNNGVNWTQTSPGGLKVMVTNGNYLFGGASGGVYLSTNNGTNWMYSGVGRDVRSLAANGNNIFAGTNGYGVYLSTNNGTNWSQTSLNNRNVYALAVSGTNLFAGTYQYGVYYSGNNGTSWFQVNEGLGNLIVDALCIFDNYVFAASSSGVYRRPLSELVGIIQNTNEIPGGFSLSQNYPNPFNPTTRIGFQISKSGFVIMKVYDVLGREISTLVYEQMQPGTYETDWDGSNYPSGVYYYKLVSGSFSDKKKMILLK